ncbi:hypothetical protein GG344DRAFT_75912 [Lentinula edodes]|nr:hypothetical protein GG344DRAFT_75912 [Lentinula edodes]
MTSLDLFDTPWFFFQSLSGPEYNIGIPEITFDLFKQANGGILIDEGWKEPNFGVVEQEQEEEEEEEEELKVEVQKKESLFYAPLFDGLNSVMGADSAVKFSNNPDKHMLFEGDHSHYKANINGLLTKTTAVFPIAEGEEYECDVFMTGELKKKSTLDTVDDNNKKVLSNAAHIMGADPTRRFIGDESAYGQYFQFPYISNFKCPSQQDAKNLIYFALSLSGACREELGYDPTVRRVQGKDGTGPRYIFTFDGKQYITTEAITVRNAKFLLGCAARVFKVQQVFNDEGDQRLLGT